MHRLTRRDLLRRSAAASLALGASAAGGGLLTASSWLRPGVAAAAVPAPFERALPLPTVLTDADIVLQAIESEVQVLDGAPTRMWTFNGTFPGPTIRRPAGVRTTVTVHHLLPEAPDGIAGDDTLTVHHHGAHSAPEHDGVPLPEFAIPRGGQRTYVYEGVEDGSPERAAMQWYHDHTHHRTSFNSYMGLAGLFILDDDFEQSLQGLPRGGYEIPMFLTDRTFDADNQIDITPYLTQPQATREFRGETHLVNGAVQPHLDVEPRRYRLRVHNGAHFALYNLKLARTGSADPQEATGADAVPLLQIGTESGLLPAAVGRDHVLMGPAERVDLVVDFSPYAGEQLVLATVSPRDTGRSLLGSPTAQPPIAGGDGVMPTVFMQFRVSTAQPLEPDPGPLPAALRPLPDWASDVPHQPDRVFVFGNGIDPNDPGRLPHSINGRPFDHQRVDATPELGSVESWLLLNASLKSHYIHLHDVDWLVVSRNGGAPAPHEAGLKETFKLDPGEFIVVATKFTDHLGPYMIHCHMLDHEDAGMMTRFDVVEPGSGQPTTLTPAEQRRTDALLAAARPRPGRPISASVVRSLAHAIVLDEDGSPYRCTLGSSPEE